MEIPLVFNIQKFSVHDGPGIRTTIFFKGCPIKCLWCHNPESQNYKEENILTKDGKIEVCGKRYSIPELLREVEKDIIFYEQSGGGVTLSGGEVMTQNIDYIEELVKKLYYKGISVVIDTCGLTHYSNFKRILPYVDRFLYDLKFINSQTHKKYTGAGNKQILENLKQLSQDGACIDLRLIQIDKINNKTEDILGIIEFLKENNVHVENIHLLPYHQFGSDKYKRLNRECQLFEKPTDEVLEKIKEKLNYAGYKTVIGG